MNIQRTIVGFDVSKAQLLVKYFTDKVVDGYVFAIDLPIDASGAAPVGAELEAIITSLTPTSQLARAEKLVVQAVANADQINALVQRDPPPRAVPITTVEKL